MGPFPTGVNPLYPRLLNNHEKVFTLASRTPQSPPLALSSTVTAHMLAFSDVPNMQLCKSVREGVRGRYLCVPPAPPRPHPRQGSISSTAVPTMC